MASVNPDRNCGLCVTIMCECRLTGSNTCTTLVWVLIRGRLVCVEGAGKRQEISASSSQLLHEFKTALKKLSLNLKKHYCYP